MVFLQGAVYENLFFILYSYNALLNISLDKKGTGVLIRKNFNYLSPIFYSSGRILSFVVREVNYVNVYAHSGKKKTER